MEGQLFGSKETDPIRLDTGQVVHIYRGLTQGIDEDLYEFDRVVKGGPGGTIWSSKLLHLAIAKVVQPDGEEMEPTLDDIRDLPSKHAAILREAVMERFYPLGWAALVELEEELDSLATRTDSGEQSTSTRDTAAPRSRGSQGPTSLERLRGPIRNTGTLLSRLLMSLKRRCWPRRGPGSP